MAVDELSELRNRFQAAGDCSEFCGTYSGAGSIEGDSAGVGAGADVGEGCMMTESTADFTAFWCCSARK